MENSVFQRHEVKFLVTQAQRKRLVGAVGGRLIPDIHGESTICNIYYDTPDFRLIRRSLEKPNYKEKVRLRSYGPAGPEDTVFLELKKKYDGIVYKRRISIPEAQATAYMEHRLELPQDSQIGREIDYCCKFYQSLAPQVYLCYDRTAFYAVEDSSLRITFDQNIRWRQDRLSLCSAPGGREILPPGTSLMEIKTAAAMPLWLVEALNQQQIRQTSFSKYGQAYMTILQKNLEESRGIYYVQAV